MGEGDGKTNTLTSVKGEPPVFTVIPPTPPTYKDLGTVGETSQYIVSSADKGSVSAALWNSDAATVFAKLVRVDTNGNSIAGSAVYVPSFRKDETLSTLDGENAKYYTYYFPVESSDLWRLESISAFNVFDDQSVLHSVPADGVNSEDAYKNGLVFAVGGDPVAILRASDVSVSVAYADGAFSYTDARNYLGVFGKDASGSVTGEFMTQQTLKAGSVTVAFDDSKDLISRGYFSVSDVSLQYLYGTGYDNSTYGGYTSTSNSGATVGVEVCVLKFQTSGTAQFTQSEDVSFTYAAQYKPGKLRYTINAGDETVPVEKQSERSQGVYTIEVWSKAPSVTVSAVTPNGTYSVDTQTSGKISDGSAKSSNKVEETKCGETTVYYDWTYTTNTKHQAGYTPVISEDRLEATVYFKCSHRDDATYSGGTRKTAADTREFHHYEYSANGMPSVTLVLSQTGELFSVAGSSATLEFVTESTTDTTVRMYTEYSSEKYSSFGVGLLGSVTKYFTDASKQVSTYSWTGENSCRRYVGELLQYVDTSNFVSRDGDDSKTPAGTLLGDTLVAVYNGATYTFSINQVTIRNPY